MDRCWFFTWRTYGTWLPGEEGFVGFHDLNGLRIKENQVDSPKSEAIRHLRDYSKRIMKGQPVYLSQKHAASLVTQFEETAVFRQWPIDAYSILPNHIHLVFTVVDDPDPSQMLQTWKSYASRALNRSGLICPGPRWFEDRGSTRKLKTDANRLLAIRYVREQTSALVIWLSDQARQLISDVKDVEPATLVAG